MNVPPTLALTPKIRMSFAWVVVRVPDGNVLAPVPDEEFTELSSIEDAADPVMSNTVARTVALIEPLHVHVAVVIPVASFE